MDQPVPDLLYVEIGRLVNTELLVNPEQITALIAMGMGETLHWFPEEVSLSSLAATLVGMANTVGGTVILGVSPRGGELVGVKNPQAAFESHRCGAPGAPGRAVAPPR